MSRVSYPPGYFLGQVRTDPRIVRFHDLRAPAVPGSRAPRLVLTIAALSVIAAIVLATMIVLR
jgi:hypothetical protein